MALKLLICGDVKGKFDDLLKRIATIEKKSGKFDSLFCIGDFFGKDSTFINDFIKSTKVCNIETLIVSPLPEDLKTIIDVNGGSICPNVTYLGNKGTCKFQNKLSFAFLSSMKISESDVKDICHQLKCTNLSYTGIDLLLTNVWPTNVEKGGNSLPKNLTSSDWGNEGISALSFLLQPRYHFTACRDIYYERLPFKNQKSNQTKHATRFLALSSFKNPQNDKYLYALQLKPMEIMPQEELSQIPNNVTDNPYGDIDTAKFLSNTTNQFFFEHQDRKRKADEQSSSNIDDDRKQSRIESNKRMQDGCWFCLGNPEVEKHLIVEVGELTYVAMPRGALTDDHLMILPVGHHQSFVSCPKEVVKEIKATMKKIVKYFESCGKSTVFFERNYKSNHFQLQAVPVESSKLETCKRMFVEMALNGNGPGENFREIPSRSNIQEIAKQGTPYFYVQFSDGDKLFGAIPRPQLPHFDLQFGRIVLSSAPILACPAKAQWKDCVQSKDTEQRLAARMKRCLSVGD